MFDRNMYLDGNALWHVPQDRNVDNSNVFAEQHVLRTPDITNSIYDGYEYSQPKGYRLVSASTFQANNPFNSPAQFCLYYARVNDANNYLALNVDSNDSSPLTLNSNILDFPGILLTQTSTSPLAPFPQWVDFQSFVLCRVGGTITTFTEFVLIFRRRREVYIPNNKTPFNGPEQ